MNSHFLKKIKVGNSSIRRCLGEVYVLLELETLGRHIVESCGGLPLAIVVLGGSSGE